MTTLREAAEQALAFCEFLWRDVPLNDYAEEMRQSVEDALKAALAEFDADHQTTGAPQNAPKQEPVPPSWQQEQK